jgi:hypothetical protein
VQLDSPSRERNGKEYRNGRKLSLKRACCID